MSQFHLVVSKIAAHNVGFNLSKDQRNKEQFKDLIKEQFVQIELKGNKIKTKYASPIEKGSDDEDGWTMHTSWEESLDFLLSINGLQKTDIVKIYIFQKGKYILPNRLLGKAIILLEELVEGKKKNTEFNVDLNDGNNRPTESMFTCNLEYVVPAEYSSQSTSKSKSELEVGKMTQHQKRTSKERADYNEPFQKNIRSPYLDVHRRSSDKEMEFQIKVKVIEARQLEGGDINPVVRVTIGNERKKTRVQEMTNRPFYNQTFSFNFTSTTFRDLCEKQIMIEVFDSRRFRSDALIGFYKCDVGVIYDMKDHILLRKWIMLTEPAEGGETIQGNNTTKNSRQKTRIGGAPAGYIKLSMVVLEADVGNSDISTPSLEDLGSYDVDEDIESNLLQLPGVILTPAVFKLKVYKAEDLPQMDPEKSFTKIKEWVDPYCTLTFAGKKATSVIKYNSTKPNFNQCLNVPFQFPSMCDKLKIQLMDWDRITADDHIGTIHISLPSISGDGGTGFLPTFGPCFVNIYGSPREYSQFPTEYDVLNKGKGEGVAYRGRVLVELETKLNAKCENEKQPLDQKEIVKVESYMRRQKFRLLASFLEATMLAVEDLPVEFEMSIGNYGNMLDKTTRPCPCSTPPTNPVFDGEKYYFLPWGNFKPHVQIDCQWEDITFRLGALNRLLRSCKRLETNIELIKLTLKEAGVGTDYENDVSKTLAQLIQDCSSLPELDPKGNKLTRLDLQLQEARQSLLSSIVAESENLIKNIRDINTVTIIEGFLKRIQKVSIEPQNCMPDVIIWMIKGGKERVAYCRIPAHELLYTPEVEERGMKCGKVIDINMKYPGENNHTDESRIPGLLRVMLWLGLPEHHGHWNELKKTGGELVIYAETYENQTSWLGKWSEKNWKRHSFSNANGTHSLPKNVFVAPDGWKFVSGDWKVIPELRSHCTIDAGSKRFLETVYENQHRLIPGGNWQKKNEITWTDIFGEVLSDENNKPIKAQHDIILPKGWEWFDDNDWDVDSDRAVDNDGWEYTVENYFGATKYEAAEKMYHFCRRRRWIRERRYVNNSQNPSLKVAHTEKEKEGWDYAISFNARFHSKRRGLDLVRRRRLHKQIVQTNANPSEPNFTIKKGEQQSFLIPPSVYLFFKKPHLCQLRAYIFQGRNLLPSDPNGLADPYVQLSFATKSAISRTIHKKLNPKWDQMLVLEGVPLYGGIEQITENPPDILLEIFDRDPVGRNEFLGRVQVEPFVLMPDIKPVSRIKLSWHKVYKGSENCGDVLAAFELFMDEDALRPLPSPDSNDWIPIPPEIRPVMQETAVEVLCWGLRNLSRFRWMSVKLPCIEVEIGDKIRKTSNITNFKKNPNFQDGRVLYFNVDLPRDEIYTPPITIRLRSNSSYGNPIIGVCVVDNLHQYRRNGEHHRSLKSGDGLASGSPRPSTSVTVEQEETHSMFTKDDDEIERFDWWSKYHASQQRNLTNTGHLGYPSNYDQLEIYEHSLEKEFDYFQDFIKTFHLYRGKIESFEECNEESIIGEFKGNFSIYDLPRDSSEPTPARTFTEEKLRPFMPVSCLIRVYIVKAYGLSPRDNTGLADPYLVVSLGNDTFDDKENYQAETLNAEFGKVFEFNAMIPVVKDLKIKVMDYDAHTLSDLIGETIVDLETRLLSQRHAMAGLPTSYNTSGTNKWRLGSHYTPSYILQQYCKDHSLDPPSYHEGNTILAINSGGVKHHYSIDEFEDDTTDLKHAGNKMERLALHVLKSFKDPHPKLVPEHVETRELFNDLYPGFSQKFAEHIYDIDVPQTFKTGKLEMFVDIFPETCGIPGPPLDISPRKPKKYELRVIIWNTKDVQLQETSILGEEMSDIFVKCKVNGVNDFQKTDVHYRSLNGDGMFNWRMVFPFEYSETEEKIIVMKKTHFFSRRAFQEKLRPELVVNVWDNDIISRNDFIGSVKLDLQNLPIPFGSSREIKTHKLKEERRSLFKQGSVRGWWPVEGNSTGKKKKNVYEPALTGKVEMTIELLESKEAETKVVGKGRDAPNNHPFLDNPQRPETSFLWITNPLKSLRYIFWRHYKWYIIGCIVLVMIILFILLFLYSAPGYTVKKFFNA